MSTLFILVCALVAIVLSQIMCIVAERKVKKLQKELLLEKSKAQSNIGKPEYHSQNNSKG